MAVVGDISIIYASFNNIQDLRIAPDALGVLERWNIGSRMHDLRI